MQKSFIHTGDEDRLLFRQVADGDERAFTVIFQKYTPKLASFLMKLTRDEVLAKEMVQETFFRFWMNRANLRGMELNPAYLFRIATNISLNHFKLEHNRARILSTFEAIDSDQSPAQLLEAKETGMLIREAVELLPAKRREIYRLSREEQMSYQEIADHLGLSMQTVKNQLSASLQFIRERLANRTGLSILTIALLLNL